MSRIHEALKKAEREGVLVHADLATESRQEKATPIVVEAPTQHEITDLQPSLRFEDLQRCCLQQWQPDRRSNVFSSGLSAKAAEQFRTLRSRLYQLRANQQLKTLLITSAVSGEGKTFLATNLAHCVARQSDRRVLLIDADLRRSQMHVPLGAKSSPGLTDYLRGKLGEVEILQYSPENNLSFIAGGSEVPDPSELLSNGRLATLLSRLKGLFDWIILDSPPSLPVADASLLAEHCDGLVVVARARITPSALVQKGCQELHGRRLVGVVLNGVEEDTLAYGNYYSAYRQNFVSGSNP